MAKGFQQKDATYSGGKFKPGAPYSLAKSPWLSDMIMPQARAPIEGKNASIRRSLIYPLVIGQPVFAAYYPWSVRRCYYFSFSFASPINAEYASGRFWVQTGRLVVCQPFSPAHGRCNNIKRTAVFFV